MHALRGVTHTITGADGDCSSFMDSDTGAPDLAHEQSPASVHPPAQPVGSSAAQVPSHRGPWARHISSPPPLCSVDAFPEPILGPRDSRPSLSWQLPLERTPRHLQSPLGSTESSGGQATSPSPSVTPIPAPRHRADLSAHHGEILEGCMEEGASGEEHGEWSSHMVPDLEI